MGGEEGRMGRGGVTGALDGVFGGVLRWRGRMGGEKKPLEWKSRIKKKEEEDCGDI